MVKSTRLLVSNCILQWFYWGVHWHMPVTVLGREDIPKLLSDFSKVLMRLESRWSGEIGDGSERDSVMGNFDC